VGDYELVIRLVNGPMSNLLSDSPRRRGDIVAMRRWPHPGWGKRVCPPTFGFVRLRGIEDYKVESRIARHREIVDAFGEKRIVRAGFWINLDRLPVRLVEALETGEPVELTDVTFRDVCVNRLQALQVG
jgi:hypothetical protein